LFLALLLLLSLPLTACSSGGGNAVEDDNDGEGNENQNGNANTNDNNSDSNNDDNNEEEEATPLAPMKVMSYNVQTGNEEAIGARAPKVIATINSFSPDVLGTQELNAYWIAEMEAHGFLDTYTMVGEPRAEADSNVASNEYSAIFFKTDTFNLIDSGTYWLSETPYEISRLDSCDYNRIMTYAVLERKSDGYKFLHVNTHLEWAHDNVDTNLLQTEIMLSLTDDVLYENGSMPVFFTGDFNADKYSDGYSTVLGWGFSDTREEAAHSSDAPTWPEGPSYIDFCFVSDGDFVTDTFSVGTDCEGSDHNPLFIELQPIHKK